MHMQVVIRGTGSTGPTYLFALLQTALLTECSGLEGFGASRYGVLGVAVVHI